jgi:hypothetical protein
MRYFSGFFEKERKRTFVEEVNGLTNENIKTF